MQPYQSYLPQMNNGYNPQVQNPYQQRMDFLQSYQQSLQPTQNPVSNNQMNVLGKIVDGIEVVKAMEIPADGNIYYFPKADGTEVYGKQWIVNEGRTRILSFKPLLEVEPNNSAQVEEKLKFDLSDESTGAFMQRFDELVGKIDRLEKSMTKSSTTTKTLTKTSTKKESAKNE